jgi:hypothetical protein
MTAEDLAKWDVSIADQKLLKPASYRQLETEVLLKNGLGTQYGLGVDVISMAGKRALEHSGEVSGFSADNFVFPDDRVAIVVLTNQDAVNAAGNIARAIVPQLLDVEDSAGAAKLEQAKGIFEGLQHGSIDRALFTENANSYFNETALMDFAASLGPLGSPASFTRISQTSRGGMIERVYSVRFAQKSLRVWTYEMPDGKLEQFQVAPQ